MSEAAAAVDAYETVIGLECHVELATRTKMFCGCRNEFGAPPNTNVCPVCLGHPGSMPVPNEKAIEYIVRIGLALGCRIAPSSLFHRKNYFYPDMPKNFQISQYDLPICIDGHLDVEVDGEARRIGITRVHMEEDTGKSTHVGATGRIAGADYSLVDYNRAGVPLVEIVSEPDMRSAEEARAYLTELRAVLESLGVSDVRMEEGSLRCDANVSVRPRGSAELGTKVEVKNLNSVRSLYRAVRFEEERQRAALDGGDPLVQETRHFDEGTGTTSSMRSKEFAFDYRYFPEPDLSPLEPSAEWVEGIRASLPELPAARRARLASGVPARRVANGEPRGGPGDGRVLRGGRRARRRSADRRQLDDRRPGGPAQRGPRDARFVQGHAAAPGRPRRLLDQSVIGSPGAKAALDAAYRTGDPIEAIVERDGLRQVSDASALEAVIDKVIAENPGPVEQFRSGKEGALNALIGPVMKETSRAANAQVVRELLHKRLSAG